MAYNKGLHSNSGGNHRGKPYVLVLLITFGIALLGVMVLHKLRERRIYTLLVKEKDQQIFALQLLLQKERDRSKGLRGKNEEMKGKLYAIRSQKMELARTVVEMQSTLDSLKDEQKLMESAFEEQQNELRLMQEKGSNVGQVGSEIVALRENLKHKEEEIKDLKRRLEIPVNGHSTIFPQIVTENGTMAAQNESEKDENSGENAKLEGDNNEGGGRSELTKFKDGDVVTVTKDEIQTDGDLGKANEDPQDDGGAAAKDIDDTEVVDGRGNKATREEHAGQLENNTDGGGRLKQLAGMKRKHGHARRTKGKRWRSIVKSNLMEDNGVSDNHMDNRKIYKHELQGRRVGKVSDEESFARENEGRDNNSPSKDKPQAILLKTENHESKEDANDMKVHNTNHQVTNGGTNIYPETQRLDETKQVTNGGTNIYPDTQRPDEMKQSNQLEESEESLVQQNWSKRHINKADKNAGQTKSNVLLEGPEELEEVLDIKQQGKDLIDSGRDDEDDDFFKESESGFEDEKDEYKEEIDESEFQPGL